jgi:hypothetical protein
MKVIHTERNNKMPLKTIRGFGSRLKPFKAVTESKKDLERSTLQVSQDFAELQANNTVDLNCIVFSLPKDLPREKKMKRLSTFAAKVADITGSDVICMAMWLPY